MKAIKKFIKENSMYALLLVVAETVLSIVCTLSFVYTDSLNYEASIIYQSLGVQTLLENLYSSTFWALILVMLAIIVIMTITSLVFKKMEYMFIGVLGWVELFILSLNFNKPVGDIISTCAMFIPIIIINIICYKKQKEKLLANEVKATIKKEAKKKVSKK